MEETFVAIQGYPNYAISDHGRVMSLRRNREMTPSVNQFGVLSVGLTEEGHVYRIPVKNLVARHFVDGESDIFNSAVIKDLNQRNLHHTNIVWRPRWFAWEYTHQFNFPQPEYFIGELVDLDSGAFYENPYECAIQNCLIIKQIIIRAINGDPVPITGQRFGFITY